MKIKTILTLILVMALAITTVNAEEENVISIVIDGRIIELDTEPVIINSRTLVPLRGVFEELGATVDWNEVTRQAIIKNETIEVLLTEDTGGILVNGRLHTLDAPATLIDDRLHIPIRFVAEALGHGVDWDGINRRVLITTNDRGSQIQDSELPMVNDRESLIQLLTYSDDLHTYINNRFGGQFGIDIMPEPEDSSMVTNDEAELSEQSATSAMEKSDDFSGTNTQVEGVDEGDLIKTNGSIIAIINSGNVKLIDPDPTAPSVLSEIRGTDSRGSVSNLYLTDDRLVMIGTSYVIYGIPEPMPLEPMPLEDKMIMPPYYNTPNTFFLVYDITDPSSPELVMDMDYEGYYVSSRLVGDDFYMVTAKSLNYWALDSMSDYEIQPKYADNLADESTVVDYEDIRYFPDYIAPSVMMTIGVDLITEESHVQAYLGKGDTVYATADNLYLGFTHYGYTEEHSTLIYKPDYTKTTSLYRFTLDDGTIDYDVKGTVPGSMLNQFSLDDYDGHLRVATTTGEMWDENNLSKNNLFILDDNMKLTGKLTDLAEGERIYSTRFSGDRVYMVTYRQVDPFFVIDASDPTSPELLGQLKIPGFSTYMHILDENHVLGFGTDTNEDGTLTNAGGLKISLFDVTDPTKPTERKKEVIGYAGTYSEIQNNHKALMISLNKGVMGFPISIASSTPYSRDFIGAYIYDISTDDFSYRGSVTHKDADNEYFNYLSGIVRLIYIDDHLYTFSIDKMVISDLETLEGVSELVFLEPLN